MPPNEAIFLNVSGDADNRDVFAPNLRRTSSYASHNAYILARPDDRGSAVEETNINASSKIVEQEILKRVTNVDNFFRCSFLLLYYQITP